MPVVQLSLPALSGQRGTEAVETTSVRCWIRCFFVWFPVVVFVQLVGSDYYYFVGWVFELCGSVLFLFW